MSHYKNIEVNRLKGGAIYVVNINRVSKRNCVNSETASELYNAFSLFESDATAQIAILASKEGVFCSVNFDSEPAPMGISRMKTTKPVIGSIEGFAVAGGLELALWCDMIVTHRQAVFGVLCRRFGVPLIDGGTVRLSKVIGFNRAKDMVLTGRSVSGEEAYSWGLANRLCEKSEDVFDASVKLCEEIIQHPQLCMQIDRQSLNESTNPNLSEHLSKEFHRGIHVVLNSNFSKGPTNFLNNFRKSNQLSTENTNPQLLSSIKPKL